MTVAPCCVPPPSPSPPPPPSASEREVTLNEVWLDCVWTWGLRGLPFVPGSAWVQDCGLVGGCRGRRRGHSNHTPENIHHTSGLEASRPPALNF